MENMMESSCIENGKGNMPKCLKFTILLISLFPWKFLYLRITGDTCIWVHPISVIGAGCCIYVPFAFVGLCINIKWEHSLKKYFTGILRIGDSCNFIEKMLPILLICYSNCHRDGSLPVSFIKKYLVQKLHLASEAEVTLSLPSFFCPWATYHFTQCCFSMWPPYETWNCGWGICLLKGKFSYRWRSCCGVSLWFLHCNFTTW